MSYIALSVRITLYILNSLTLFKRTYWVAWIWLSWWNRCLTSMTTKSGPRTLVTMLGVAQVKPQCWGGWDRSLEHPGLRAVRDPVLNWLSGVPQEDLKFPSGLHIHAGSNFSLFHADYFIKVTWSPQIKTSEMNLSYYIVQYLNIWHFFRTLSSLYHFMVTIVLCVIRLCVCITHM